MNIYDTGFVLEAEFWRLLPNLGGDYSEINTVKIVGIVC